MRGQVTMARSKATVSAIFKLGRRSAGTLASSTLLVLHDCVLLCSTLSGRGISYNVAWLQEHLYFNYGNVHADIQSIALPAA